MLLPDRYKIYRFESGSVTILSSIEGTLFKENYDEKVPVHHTCKLPD